MSERHRVLHVSRFIVLALILSAVPRSGWAQQVPAGPAPSLEPVGLYLTWQQDPTTTMSQDGIVYMGDGCWGTDPREIGRDQVDETAWYIHRAHSTRHFILVTIHGPHQHFLTVDNSGTVIDEYPETPRPRRIR